MTRRDWLLLELEGEWQMIVPDNDIKPHSKVVMNFPNGEKKAFLDDIDCPCRPNIDWDNKIIIHNAFDERE